MRSRLLKAGAAVALATAIALSLAACDPASDFNANEPPGPVAYTVVNGAAVVRACIPLTIQDIDITSYASLSDDTGTDVWEADGETKVKAGEEFVLGTALHGMTVDTDKHKDYLEKDMSVDLSVVDVDGKYHDIFSDIDQDTLVEGSWLNGDGDATSKPCSPGSCPDGASGCSGRWHGVAAAEGPTPTISPTSSPSSAPAFNANVDPISFTLKDGAVYAKLCVAVGAGSQTFSPPEAALDAVNGPTDVETTTSRKSPSGTKWQLGQALPGGQVVDGAGQHFAYSKGLYTVDVVPTVGGSEILGKFQAQDLAEGAWLDSAGKHETFGCSTYRSTRY